MNINIKMRNTSPNNGKFAEYCVGAYKENQQ